MISQTLTCYWRRRNILILHVSGYRMTKLGMSLNLFLFFSYGQTDWANQEGTPTERHHNSPASVNTATSTAATTAGYWWRWRRIKQTEDNGSALDRKWIIWNYSTSYIPRFGRANPIIGRAYGFGWDIPRNDKCHYGCEIRCLLEPIWWQAGHQIPVEWVLQTQFHSSVNTLTKCWIQYCCQYRWRSGESTILRIFISSKVYNVISILIIIEILTIKLLLNQIYAKIEHPVHPLQSGDCIADTIAFSLTKYVSFHSTNFLHAL